MFNLIGRFFRKQKPIEATDRELRLLRAAEAERTGHLEDNEVDATASAFPPTVSQTNLAMKDGKGIVPLLIRGNGLSASNAENLNQRYKDGELQDKRNRAND